MLGRMEYTRAQPLPDVPVELLTERIRPSAAQFQRLATAFLAAVETKFVR